MLELLGVRDVGDIVGKHFGEIIELDEQASAALQAADNRRRFWEQAERELALSRRHGIPLALVAIDIDHFKAINDTHGHLVGDQVLRAFADTCRQALRSTDLCARTGGEEFCVLLPATDLGGARTMAERIRDQVTRLRLDAQTDAAAELRVSASFGLACSSERTPVFDALFSHADQALYVAKRAGRNRVAAWEELLRPPSE